MNLVCNSIKCNGKFIPYTLVDGYPVGDRLLEGVMFQASINKTGAVKIEIDLSCADYFAQFNKSMWYKRMEHYFKSALDQGDLVGFVCPICKDAESIEVV